MKKALLLFVAMAFATTYSFGQTQLYQNSFETTTGWSLSHTFDDGFNDYCKQDTAGGFSYLNTLTGVDGDYLIGAEDTDSEPSSPSDGVVTLTLDSIFIDGFSSLELTFGMATPGGSNYDQCTFSNGDSVLVEARVDTGSYQRLAFFCSPAGSNNPRLFLDTSGNRIGGDFPGEDSTDANLRDWTFPISGSGKYLEIRVKFRFDSGSEEVAFDNFRINGTGNCGNPQQLSASNVTSSSADLSWWLGASFAQVQWETTGFTLGNGFKDTTSSSPYTITGLTAGTTYDAYVKDSCGGSSSSWLGPLTFSTVGATCNDPSSVVLDSVSYTIAVLSWTTGGASIWNIEWDTAGFTPGSGNMVMATGSNPYTISGLSPSTAYEFYVQDTCNGVGTSNWVGPFTFATATVPAYTIAQIHSEDINGVADSAGVYCWTAGIVSGGNLRTSGLEFYLNDGNNNAGIVVFDFSFSSYTVTHGDSLRVRGTVSQFNGLTQFRPDSIEIVSSGNALPFANVVLSMDESTEGQLLEFAGVTLVDPSQWPASALSGSGANIDIRTASGDTVTMRISRETDIDGNVPVPSGSFTVRGNGGQWDFSSPYTSGYQLMPRFQADIIQTYPSVFLNEIASLQDSLIQDPDDNDYDDFIEIYNPNNDTVDLALYYLSDGTNAYRIPVGGSETQIEPGGHLLLWADDSTQFGSNHMAFTLDTNGHVSLLRPDSVLADSVTYPSLGLNESFGRQPDGVGAWVIYNGTNGTVPTPGDTNDLPAPPPIPAYTIGQVNVDDANGEPDSLGVYCSLMGTVISPDLDGNSGLSFQIHDGTGGINVFNFNDVDNYVVRMGDSIRVYGEIDFYRGLTEIFVDSIDVLDSNRMIMDPTIVTTLDASTESELITIEDVYIVDAQFWPAPGAFSENFDIVTPAGDTLIMRIDTDFDIEDSMLTPPSGLFTVTGFGGQFDKSSPYTEGYQIFPRFVTDIDSSVCAVADGLTTDSVSTTTGSVSWNNNGAVSWDLQWGTGGTPSDSVLGLTSTSYTITGLMDSTTYDYWVRANCATKVADWSDPAQFSTDTIADTSTAVIDLSQLQDAFIVYPNPVENGKVLNFNKEVSYRLYNVVGQAIRKGKARKLDTTELETGVYLIQTAEGETVRLVVR